MNVHILEKKQNNKSQKLFNKHTFHSGLKFVCKIYIDSQNIHSHSVFMKILVLNFSLDSWLFEQNNTLHN